MTVEGFSTLIHEVRSALDRTPIRSGVYDALVGEVRVAQFIAEHAKTLDDIRTGLNRSMLELALRNILMRPELAHAHDAAQRALKVVLSHGDERKIAILPPGPRAGSSFGDDVDLALVHVRDALELARAMSPLVAPDEPNAARILVEKLEGVVTILQRVSEGFAS